MWFLPLSSTLTKKNWIYWLISNTILFSVPFRKIYNLFYHLFLHLQHKHMDLVEICSSRLFSALNMFHLDLGFVIADLKIDCYNCWLNKVTAPRQWCREWIYFIRFMCFDRIRMRFVLIVMYHHHKSKVTLT